MLDFLAGVITAARERASAVAVGLSLATVSVATGFISYTHISALTQDYWQNWKTAHLMPLAVDGQIVIGSVYFMEHSGERKRWLGLIGVVPGILESLYSNWESVSPPPGTLGLIGVEAHVWATVPAQAFACSTILFERWLHTRRQRAQGAPKSNPLAVLATAPLTALRLAAALAEQAPEPPAPGLEPEAVSGPAPVHVMATAPAESPWGLAPAPAGAEPEPVPAAEPAPAAPVPTAFRTGLPVPVVGPVMSLASRPARVPAPRAVPATADAGERLPLPEDEAELKAVVRSMGRNELTRLYQVSKNGADKLRQRYITNDEEVASRAA